MKKGIISAVAGALAFLAGCGDMGNNPSKVSADSRWKGAPYRLTFDTKDQKPNPAGITIPTIDYTANPEALERRAVLVLRIDTAGVKTDRPLTDQMTMPPTDISGPTGALSAAYMNSADQGLAKLLVTNCMKGKVKVTVALAKSSLSPQPKEAEVNNKRLSDWMPIELEFKNAHPKC